MNIAIVLGTRPEIIKMSPVIKELAARRADYSILHTGQHYSYELDKVFFEQLGLPPAKYNLEVGSGTHATQTAEMLIGIEAILQREPPGLILVEGDTNSVLAGALAATKLHIRVGHIEAGLRSYDREMPEELNRILVDHCSDYLFAPTAGAREILLGEGIPQENIFVTGNPVVDVVYQNVKMARENGNMLATMYFKPKEYVLATVHRQENIDNRARFDSILKGLNKVIAEFQLPVIYPIHPHSRRTMGEFNLGPGDIRLSDPLDFLGFLELESNAKLILTDSGGVQEEACILGVPCVTLRDNTERPETLEVGANILAGTDADNILACSRTMLGRENSWVNPFGDGQSGKKIVEIIEMIVEKQI